MGIIVKSSKTEQDYKNKTLITVGTNPKCDFVLNLDYDVLLTIQYNDGICQIINNFKSPNILFKGEMLTKTFVDKVCVLTLQNSSEYLEISIKKDLPDDINFAVAADVSQIELEALYGDDEFSDIKIKVEKARGAVERARTAIIKQISYPIAELKSKIKANLRTTIFLHVGLYVASLFSSFAIANYMMGLTVQESTRNVYLATNIQAWVAYSFVVFAIGLLLKQGVFLMLNEKQVKSVSPNAKLAKHFMLWISTLFILGIYATNLTYFSIISQFKGMAMFITFFFTGILSALAIGCGFFKASSAAYSALLSRYEFREDFEAVIKAYRVWIERYINNLPKVKINSIKDRLFMCQLKTLGEAIIGILTAPFLAYGVSNTLAMCFPEAAGWTRISGLRFSPIFLVLATFLIIFAFFAFVNAFTAIRKVRASNVIKQDGFSDYRQHGATIYGLEGAKKLESDIRLFFGIACSIVFIEFMMNVSYFLGETGGNAKGVFLSFVAALVPTALLIAETFMLASTRFDVYACDELLAKLDKEL